MINFISNLPRELRSGGFSAMNAAACAALASRHSIDYVGPIDPPVAAWGKALSKARRVTGLGGDFTAFSERRLEVIAREVGRLAATDAELDFFHGLTPWIATHPRRPYAAWSDCTFADYIEIYHDRGRFRAGDLARIEAAEAAWLKSARQALFTSDWAAGRAVDRYGLDPARVGSVGIFGEFEPPDRDAFAGGQGFVFVSTDFRAKGGPVVLAAFRRLRETHPDAALTIVGAAPGDGDAGAGVSYAGYLRKEVPEEHRRFREILGGAVGLVHPTRSDIAPLLLVEAAMFGVPAIATRAFAIPELVRHGETGWLLDDPTDAGEAAAAMRRLLDDLDYRRLREGAWRHARSEHGKDRFEARMLASVERALVEASEAAA
ncbi:MAG: glycosyltransferase family 4 protein [Caulobacteraceae bacterium]